MKLGNWRKQKWVGKKRGEGVSIHINLIMVKRIAFPTHAMKAYMYRRARYTVPLILNFDEWFEEEISLPPTRFRNT